MTDTKTDAPLFSFLVFSTEKKGPDLSREGGSVQWVMQVKWDVIAE